MGFSHTPSPRVEDIFSVSFVDSLLTPSPHSEISPIKPEPPQIHTKSPAHWA
jgi:hypothetical protein